MTPISQEGCYRVVIERVAPEVDDGVAVPLQGLNALFGESASQ